MVWSKRKKALLLSLLGEEYPNASSELNFTTDFELVVAVALSAQCTDKKVNEITPLLFSRYPDFYRLSQAGLADVEEIIRPINYYKSKAKHIVAMAKIVTEDFAGILPTQHSDLISLPGVGRKTANVILSEKGVQPALAVDTHVYRVSRRLGLTHAESASGVESDLCEAFNSGSWRQLHHSLILHGRRTCKAINPLCGTCSLTKICDSFDLYCK